MSDHLLYALAWVVFGLSHSGLAGRHWLGRWSRLTYNLVALAALGGVAWAGAVLLGDRPAFVLPSWGKAALGGVHAAGWALLLIAARGYDLGRLGGLFQARNPGQPEDEPLRTSGLHARMRHPLYAGGFLILWGAAVTPLGLATAIWGSLYLLAGARFEERRLLARYGEAYARYRATVPAFLPRWKPPTATDGPAGPD